MKVLQGLTVAVSTDCQEVSSGESPQASNPLTTEPRSLNRAPTNQAIVRSYSLISLFVINWRVLLSVLVVQSQVPGERVPAVEDGVPAQTGRTGRGSERREGGSRGELKDTSLHRCDSFKVGVVSPFEHTLLVRCYVIV